MPLAELLAFGVVYYVICRLGLGMASPAREVSVIWPGTGVALAALVLRGRRLWPAILAGAFAANVATGTAPGVASWIAIGNTLEALVGATALLRVGFNPGLRRLHDVASLFVLAACLSTIVSATIGVAAWCAAGIEPWGRFGSLWPTWWIGDAVSDLVGAPFLFVWAERAAQGWRFRHVPEATLLVAAMLVLSVAVFASHGTPVPYPVHYLIFPAIIWAAVRLGQHGTATLVLGALAVTIIATVNGRGPFVTPSIESSLLHVTLFMAVVAVTGLFLGAATAERNLSERRRSADYARLRLSEERLARQAEELATADRRKDEFLAVLGHELRNPLAPLQNGLELLSLGSADPSMLARTRALMERQLRHLVRLVDDLLDVARIRSGKIVLELARVPLDAMISSAVELARPLIDSRGHHLEVLVPAEPIWIDADRTRLPQLITNLLNNAAKYTPDGGRITIRAGIAPPPGKPESASAMAEVRVTDSGIGMTPEALANVFELFAQAAGPEHTVHGGLGVGLSLARSIAELHGGTLIASSEGPGKGSEFLLRLPLSTASNRTGTPEPARQESTRTSRILVVDDNVDAADSLGTMLQFAGHEVRIAYGGLDALAAAAEFVPDAMILDLGMPEVDGYAVARAVRADQRLRHARVIALSGYGQPDDRRRTAQAGFDAHLVKPVVFEALRAALADKADAPGTRS